MEVQNMWPSLSAFHCQLVRVDGLQIIVRPSSEDGPGRRGHLLRALENGLRYFLNEPVEVYCEMEKDQNKPRDPAQRQRIMDWLEARKAIKERGASAQQ